MASSITGKRKREASPEIGLVLSSCSVGPDEVGPVLVNFPSLEAPSSAPFRCYRKKARTSNEEGRLIVAGETDTVEFESNEEESSRVASAGCQYVLAVHNKRTSALTVLPAPLSPHILSRTVKALKSIEPSAAPSATEYFQAKTALGETFGTKKAKAAIRARERNRVDISAMEGTMDFVMAGIDKAAQGLMTADEAKELSDSSRQIPVFDATATEPADVYPLHGIIPEPEWKTLPVNPLQEASSAKERKATLPHQKSRWLNSRVELAMGQDDKERRRNIKILFYIACMMAFRSVTERKFKKEKLVERLSGVPGSVVDSLLDRFTECTRGSTEPQSTPELQLLLLTHILALCLHAADKITLTFKALGCKIRKLTERERTKLGLAGEEKRAVLTAPVEFPKPKLKKTR
ncbi:Rpa49 subunit specific to nuclear RNA polymerase I [Roridomyces roridus]|uniref:Rpa49 subunit specific to nuclear RNA polymerase I n=1 Tax=Roridomyces roridus TaxID=1738132 RepID=A0AAD7BFJ8_9AGAR|nr:Rpa49 subunit specific to nuclear RNA polymerase I [Roridomyces roridus]